MIERAAGSRRGEYNFNASTQQPQTRPRLFFYYHSLNAFNKPRRLAAEQRSISRLHEIMSAQSA
jgi:hypothetical protein